MDAFLRRKYSIHFRIIIKCHQLSQTNVPIRSWTRTLRPLYMKLFNNHSGLRGLPCLAEGIYWATGLSRTTPFTEGRLGVNNKASPPGRHQEQAPKQRCTFRPTTFSSVQFSSVQFSSTTAGFSKGLPYHTIATYPSQTSTYREPWVCYRRRTPWLRLALAFSMHCLRTSAGMCGGP